MNPDGIHFNPQQAAQFAFELLGTDRTIDPEDFNYHVVGMLAGLVFKCRTCTRWWCRRYAVPSTGSEPSQCQTCGEKTVMKKKILVVSHEQTITNYLRILLESGGYGVETETSSEAAIQAARESAPNLLIIDPVMPDASGVEAASRISREVKCGVLFLTTQANDSAFRENLHRLRAAGCKCRAMALPFEKADLFRKMRLLT